MMRAWLPPLVLAACAPCLALAQARGPSVQEIQEFGQYIPSEHERRQEAWEDRARVLQEQQAPLDEATRERMYAELDTWLRRLPGRFSIEGEIERVMVVSPAGPGSEVRVPRTRDVTGIADCREIGEGVGLHCILNATWPSVDNRPAMLPTGRIPTLPPSEMLETMRPAVLVLGLDQEQPGIRAMMVNADSLSHTWVGPLRESTARANRVNRCLSQRCLQPLEIIAAPDSEDIAIILRSGGITITLAMVRDPDAHAEKKMKLMRAR